MSPQSKTPSRPKRRAAAADMALATAALILLLAGLGSLDLWAPDEPRYGQVAEELRRMDRGPQDLVLLRLAGEPYTQKPPLYFWLAAAVGATRGGVDEWAARLPSALAGLATLVVWVALGRRFFPGTPVGWITGALLLTSFRFVHFARRAQLDVLLTLFESLCLWAFLEWRDARDDRRRRRALILLHGATALALLTKGPVGLLPWACFAVVLAAEGRAAEIRSLLPLRGLALAIGPVLLWISACLAWAPAGFFEAAIVENLWARFADGTDHARPIWYFIGQLPIEALPWSLLWPTCALWAWRHRAPGAGDHPPQAAERAQLARRVIAAWILVPLVFFSLSAGKRGIYMLPALPALCLWAAVQLHDMRCSGLARRWLEGPAIPLLCCALLGAIAVAPWPGLEADGHAFARAAITAGRTSLLAVSAAGIAAALVLGRIQATGRLPSGQGSRLAGALIVWSMVVAAWALAVFAILPTLEAEKSPRPIAEAMTTATRPGEHVGLFAQSTLLGGLLFYGERPVVLLETPAAFRMFQAAGGRVVAVRASHARWLQAVTPFRRIDRLRHGRREQWIVEIGPSGAQTATTRASNVRGTVAYVPDSLRESAHEGLSGGGSLR